MCAAEILDALQGRMLYANDNIHFERVPANTMHRTDGFLSLIVRIHAPHEYQNTPDRATPYLRGLMQGCELFA